MHSNGFSFLMMPLDIRHENNCDRVRQRDERDENKFEVVSALEDFLSCKLQRLVNYHIFFLPCINENNVFIRCTE